MADVYARPALGREVRPDTFADVTTASVVEVAWEPDGWLRVTFAADVDDATRRAVWERMVSHDWSDEARRIALRKAAADNAINLAAMTAAYVLGDPMPAPVPPTTTTTTTTLKT